MAVSSDQRCSCRRASHFGRGSTGRGALSSTASFGLKSRSLTTAGHAQTSVIIEREGAVRGVLLVWGTAVMKLETRGTHIRSDRSAARRAGGVSKTQKLQYESWSTAPDQTACRQSRQQRTAELRPGCRPSSLVRPSDEGIAPQTTFCSRVYVSARGASGPPFPSDPRGIMAEERTRGWRGGRIVMRARHAHDGRSTRQLVGIFVLYGRD